MKAAWNRRGISVSITAAGVYTPTSPRATTWAADSSADSARGERRKAARAPEAEPAAAEIDAATSGGLEPALAEAATVEPANVSRADARRWAVLMRRIYEVDPLVCPKCTGTMRMIALIQEPKVIDQLLRHLRTKGRDARAGPWATGLSPPADAASAAALL